MIKQRLNANYIKSSINPLDLCSPRMVSGFGQYHTNEPDKPKGQREPYAEVGFDDIRAMLDNPKSLKKEQAQWLIPSTYPSRNFKQQEKHGEYFELWGDIDTNPPALGVLETLVNGFLGGADYEIYSSRSAKLDCQKARILIFLEKPLCFFDWHFCQTILNDLLEKKGVAPDRSNERAAQLCYLPNRGEFYGSKSRREGNFFKPLLVWGGYIEELCNQEGAQRIELELLKSTSRTQRESLNLTGSPDLIGNFNGCYTVAEWLTTAGYEQKGNCFRLPNSESVSYSAMVKNGRVHSLSTRDPLFSDGEGAHNAFSVFCVLMHNGDRNAALRDAGDNLLTINGLPWNHAVFKTKGKPEREILKKSEDSPEERTLAVLAGSYPSDFEWKKPNAIETKVPPVQMLNNELIPEPFRPWLADVSHRMQTPPDFAAISALVITGSVIGAGCSIRPKRLDDWEVIPNVWGACIGRPSVVLKSPSMKEPMQLLERLQADYGDQYEKENAGSEFDSLANKAALDDIKTKLAKAAKGKGKDSVINPDEMQKLKADYLELKDSEAPEPTRRLFKTNETSIQSMTVLQNQNERGILVFRDELTGLLVKWDREDGADERAYFLEGWNGNGSYTDVKIGRGVTDAKSICISLLGGIQPDKLKRYLYQAMQGNNDGLMQRLQLAVWPDEPECWQLIDTIPNKTDKQRAYSILKDLAELDFIQYGAAQSEYDDRPYFRFDEAGQQVFNEWFTELQNIKIQQEENPLMVEHFGKFRSLMPSLALIFHCIDMADGKARGNVSAQAARLAVDWCKYLESHARRIYAMAESPEHEAAVRLADKIKAGALLSPFTAKDVYGKHWHGLKDRPEVEAACNILIDENWLMMTRKPKPATGRPPLPEYYINPVFL